MNDYWRLPWHLMIAGVSICGIISLRKKLPWEISLLLGFTLIVTLIRLYLRNKWHGLGDTIQITMTHLEMSAALHISVMVGFYLLLQKVRPYMIGKTIEYLAYVNFFLSTYGLTKLLLSVRPPDSTSIFSDLTKPIGLMGNPSMNACLLAVSIPFVPFMWRIPIGLLVLFHSSSMGVLTLASVVFTMLVQSRYKLYAWLSVLLSPLVFSLVGTDSSGRYEKWEMIVKFWSTHFGYLSGSGIGTTEILLPYSIFANPKGFGASGSIWFFAHNDWLQIWMEAGIVGLILSIIVLGVSLHRAPLAIIPSLIGYGIWMLGNFPMHYGQSSAIGCMLLVLARNGEFSGRKETVGSPD